MKDLKKIQEFFSQLSEREEFFTGEKEKYKIDTIKMGIPLFLRMLEYAKEDAKTDMDLHKVTENAIKLANQGKVLNMTDYDFIVGSNQETLAEKVMAKLKGKKKLQESYDSKIYTIEGVFTFSDQRNITDILSDIRATSGITIVNIIDSVQKGNKEILKLSLKIDPSPFDSFSKETLKDIMSEIKKLPGVLGGKFTSSLNVSN